MNIFIDADAFIGFFHDQDELHERVVEVINRLSTIDDIQFFTSWEVVVEVSTKMSYFLNKRTSVDFLEYIDSNQITVLYANYEMASLAKEIFHSLKTGRVSMTDSMNMAWCRKLEIGAIFSYDKIYSSNGIVLIKDSSLLI